MNKTKQSWDDYSDSYYKKHKVEQLYLNFRENPKEFFHPDTFQLIQKFIPSLKAKKICVLASGDNLAAFAFKSLGAEVLSVDFSENQLKNAQKISDKYNLNIDFQCSDIRNLNSLQDNEFDLVFTSNGVFVWIDKLEKLFSEIYRILKNEGIYACREVHPFQRPWYDSTTEIKIKKSYFSIGPFEENKNNYHWKMDDILNSLVKAKLQILEVKEEKSVDDSWWGKPNYENRMRYTESLHNWKNNPLAGLPIWISIICKKLL